MDRILIAYLLIALIVIGLACAIALRVYSTPERRLRRRRRKERDDHRQRNKAE